MYSWAVERIHKEEDREKFDLDLTAPLPGQKATRSIEARAEEETSALMQFGAEFGAMGG